MSASTDLALVFDLGNVLIGWNPRNLYRKLFNDEQAMERFLAEVRFDEWNYLQDSGRSFEEGIAELCRQHPQYCDLIRTYDARFAESITGPIEGTVEILCRLRAAGYPLYALSNWSLEKFRMVRPQYEFLDWFDRIIISGEEGVAKPDPRIYEILLQRINRTPQECLLIDDSARNLVPARQMGFQTIRFESSQQLQAALSNMGLL